MAYTYVVNDQARTIATGITILQIKAGAVPLELIRAMLSQKSSTTSTQERIQIVRKSVAATVTSITPAQVNNPNDPAALAVGSTSGTGRTGSAEGTDGTILVDDAFNILNGWLWLPTPDERIWVPPSGIIALKFPLAPASQAWNAALYFKEHQG